MRKQYAGPEADILLFGTSDAVLNSPVETTDEDFGSWSEEWGN